MADKENALPRREFFMKGGAALGVAGAAIISPAAVNAASADTGKPTSGDYQETAHVKTYYELAKF